MIDAKPVSLTDLLTSVSGLWCQAHEASETRLGRTVLNDGAFFARLGAGRGPTTATLERFAVFLHDSANWPDGLVPQEACEFAHRVGVSAPPDALSAGKTLGDSPSLNGEAA